MREFDFDPRIYAHSTIKRALEKAQYDKCCFCESDFSAVAYGDVEHFRPKKGYRQTAGERIVKPGYYWLVYEWSNLFLSCELCNQKFKKNLFPLLNPDKRARSHRDNIKCENPLLINPAEENAEEFISFREGVPYAIEDNPRGKTTIKILGLDRDKLNKARQKHYEYLKCLNEIAHSNLPMRSDAKALLEKAVQESEQYAAMARAAIASRFSLDA